MQDLADDDFDLEGLEVTGGDEIEEDTDSDVDDAPVVQASSTRYCSTRSRKAARIYISSPTRKPTGSVRDWTASFVTVAQPPVQLAQKVCARVKVMARLDIAERRLPQDGRIKMKLSKSRAIDFRVNTCPTLIRREDRAAYP